MKLLFLIFHGFDESNGISKKIKYQVKALRECGIEVHICWLDDTADGHKRRMINEDVLLDYGYGVKAKILKRSSLSCIADYAKKEGLESVYIRCDHNTTPFLINLISKFKKTGIKVVMEIPTYPYDQEYKGLDWSYQPAFLLDKALRGLLFKHIDKVVTFSDHEIIFNRPTIRISNGIDFNKIPLKKIVRQDNKIVLTGVADMHIWHGYDRAVIGLGEYYKNGGKEDIVLNLVGGGTPDVIEQLVSISKQYNITDRVVFHGPLFGEELDAVFNQTDMGIASLARHRSGITHIKTLKNREFAARGIPFVYSETDDDFENMPYVMKAEAVDKPLDISLLIQFVKNNKIKAEDIRYSVETSQSWTTQMQIVISELFKQ